MNEHSMGSKSRLQLKVLLLIAFCVFLGVTTGYSRDIEDYRFSAHVYAYDYEGNRLSNARITLEWRAHAEVGSVDLSDSIQGYTDSNGYIYLEHFFFDHKPVLEWMRASAYKAGFYVSSSSGTHTTTNHTMYPQFWLKEDSNGNTIYDGYEQPLAEKFCPIVYMHNKNYQFPTKVEDVYGYNNLALQSQDSNAYAPLPVTTHNPATWESWYATQMAGKIPQVYYQIARQSFQEYGIGTNTWYVVQYWFYYPINDACNLHEGDWEHIDVIVDSPNPAQADPFLVVYNRHRTRTPIMWANVQKSGNHPYVYVGGKVKVRTLIGNKSREPRLDATWGNSGEITGGSFPYPGNHYNVDYSMSASEGRLLGIIAMRADEEIVAGSSYDHNQYNLDSLTLNNYPWMSYKGYWGVSNDTIKSHTSYESLTITVVTFGWVIINKTVTFPEFSNPPRFPYGRERDDFGKVVMYGNSESGKLYGSFSDDVYWLIRYAVLGDTHVKIRIYNVLGREVKTLVNSIKSDGYYEISWNWLNNSNVRVAYNNAYYYKIDVTPNNLVMHSAALIEK